MTKELIIENEPFVFSYHERYQQWILSDADYLGGYDTDLRIDKSAFPDGNVDWEQVKKFILYLRDDFGRVLDNINGAAEVLKALFKEASMRFEEWNVIEDTRFELIGISFKGYSKQHPGDFIYDYLMMPYYTKDRLRDIGTDLWRASFIRYNIYSVSRDI